MPADGRIKGRSAISRLVFAATVSLVAGAAAAQTLSPAGSPTLKAPGTSREQTITRLPGTPTNPKANTIAGAHVPAGPQTLRVRYLTDTNNPVNLFADGLTFACAPEPGNPTPVTACTAQADSKTVDLSATYGKSSPLTPIQPKVSGKQWSGACAGTAGDTCHVTMTGPQTVGLDFYAKP